MRKLLREKWRRIVFLILMSLCIIPDTDMQPILSPALALFAGIVVANTMGNPFEKLSREAVKTLLKIAIVGLGFGIHADKAMQAGGKGVLLTVFSIALTLTLEGSLTWEAVRPDAEAALRAYFAELVQGWADASGLTVRLSQVETRMLDIPGVLDVQGTRLNGGLANVTLEEEEIPVLGVMSHGA